MHAELERGEFPDTAVDEQATVKYDTARLAEYIAEAADAWCPERETLASTARRLLLSWRARK